MKLCTVDGPIDHRAGTLNIRELHVPPPPSAIVGNVRSLALRHLAPISVAVLHPHALTAYQSAEQALPITLRLRVAHVLPAIGNGRRRQRRCGCGCDLLGFANHVWTFERLVGGSNRRAC